MQFANCFVNHGRGVRSLRRRINRLLRDYLHNVFVYVGEIVLAFQSGHLQLATLQDLSSSEKCKEEMLARVNMDNIHLLLAQFWPDHCRQTLSPDLPWPPAVL